MALKEVTNNLGFQQITPGATSTALTVPAGARIAVIDVEVAVMRWRDDGTAPSATVGMRILSGGELRYDGELQKLRIIQEGAGAIANVSYYA
jgi:hypothetical protein